MKTATPTPRHPTAKAQPRSRQDFRAIVAVLMFRSNVAESDFSPASVTIMTRASVDCRLSSTNPAIQAEASAVRPANPVSRQTASRRLAFPLSVLGLGLRFAIGLG